MTERSINRLTWAFLAVLFGLGMAHFIVTGGSPP